MIPIRKIIRKIERFVIYRILHADDTPHRLALGIALGVFIAWTPTIGFQMLLVLLLAPAFRANSLVGVPFVWLSNPFTLIPIYFSNYWLGHRIFGLFHSQPALDYADVAQRLGAFSSVGYFLSHFHEADFWHKVITMLCDFGLELWFGSLILGLFFGLTFYIVAYKFIVWYRTHTPRGQRFMARWHRKKLRNS